MTFNLRSVTTFAAAVSHISYAGSMVAISVVIPTYNPRGPLADLLEEGEGQLSGPVLARSRMVKLMKTAAAIREQVGDQTQASRLVGQLIEQILEIMPELADVTPWHTVGQRRTLDDVGRAARNTVSDDLFGR